METIMTKLPKLFAMALLGVCAAASTASAAPEKDPMADAWLTPAVSYGAVKALPDAAVQLEPKRTYKVLFNVTQAAKQPDQLVPGFERAARFMNLAALAKVPKENLKIVVVVHGKATPSILSAAAYKAEYGHANPNLDLLAELADAGVEVFACGQALAHHKLDADSVTSGVEVVVAALTVLANYQMDGYALVPQ
jgi:intracellular sulfur oxidation DsrE/DsrF family protein